ncbi:MAG: hypothetical protein K0R63_1561 [Rickettsiales bacterium]|nr:hypothetical protein [Rickettsiales bacterium]
MTLFRPIYMDYQATTPTDPRVVKAMLPYFTERPGNPHSAAHLYGWEAEEAVDIAREEIAGAIGADPKEIIFTSSATESNNLAIKGFIEYLESPSHVITVATEHKCVLESCKHLERHGHRVTYLSVQADGLIDLKTLENAIEPTTRLISVMAVNNETGVIQPLEAIGAMAKKRNIIFHTDAAQAVGKIPLDVNALAIDLMSISGHKIYGPKGVGALYIRRRPGLKLQPQLHGGGQERGLRSGTLPTPLIVGLGKAVRFASDAMNQEAVEITALAKRFIQGIRKIPGTVLHGHPDAKIPGCINVGFEGIEGGALLLSMKGLAVSSGSACTSTSIEPSYVLRAMGVAESLARASIRFGIGRFTKMEDIERALDNVVENVEKLRTTSTATRKAQ